MHQNSQYLEGITAPNVAFQPNLYPNAFGGQVKVTVDRCYNISGADRGGKSSDAYCIISLGPVNRPPNQRNPKGEIKTKVVKKTLYPIFEESFNLQVNDLRTEWVYIDLYDWDRFSKDDFIGQCSLPLCYLAAGIEHTFNVGIIGGRGVCVVKLLANFGYQQQFQLWCQQTTQGSIVMPRCGNLELNILKCKGLKAADLNGSSDPYLKVWLKGGKRGKKPILQTKPIKKTLKPEFNVSTRLLIEDMDDEYIVIEVYDWDRFSKDDLIGKGRVSLRNLVFGMPIEYKCKLKKQGKCKCVITAFDFGYPVTNWQAPIISMVQPNPLQEVVWKYDIDEYYHDDLLSLRAYDIVIIGDDSGSMTWKAGGGKTRWQELKEVMEIVVDVGAALDSDGVDIIFLNRQGKDNVRSYAEVQNLFTRSPSGGTALTAAINTAIRKKSNQKPMLLVICTDGVPDNMNAFVNVLKNRDHKNIPVSILACSENDNEVGYLNKLDKSIKRVDVLDDYRSERKEVLKKQGKDFPYGFSDHVARLLLGPVCKKYDRLDEKKL